MLIDDIKAIAKDGADLSAIEGQIAKLNPLSGLQSKEEAWEVIKSNPYMLSAFDSEQSKRAEKVLDNFRNGKMKEEMSEVEKRIRAELNPEESDADKQLREVREQLKAMQQEKELSLLQDQLSNKAKEMGFDPIRARSFAVYGEKAFDTLEDFAKWQNGIIEERLSSELKGNFTQRQPKTSSSSTNVTMTRQEYNTLSPYEQRSFVVDQKGVVVDK